MSVYEQAGPQPREEVPPRGADGAPNAVPTRHAALMRAISSLRPSRGGRFPVETVLLTVGAVCLPIGVVAIILGWYGAAHTGHLYEQNDYMISGGLFGLGLVFIGGFFYFCYWTTRQIRVSENVGRQTQRALSRLEAQMAAVAVSTAALVTLASGASENGNGVTAHDPSATDEERPRGAGGALALASGRLVVTEHGTLLHRRECPVVAGMENVRPVDPATPGYRPCGVCAPLDDL